MDSYNSSSLLSSKAYFHFLFWETSSSCIVELVKLEWVEYNHYIQVSNILSYWNVIFQHLTHIYSLLRNVLSTLPDFEFPWAGTVIHFWITSTLGLTWSSWPSIRPCWNGWVQYIFYVINTIYLNIYSISIYICNFNNSFWFALLCNFAYKYIRLESFSLCRGVYNTGMSSLLARDWNICSKILPKKMSKICLPCVYKVHAVCIFMTV